MSQIYGIDVSQYQGEVDYKKVKASGKEFVFVRLGWAGWDGALKLDGTAVKNITAAKRAGMHVGVYVYSYCKTEEAAKKAANQTLEIVKKYEPLEYPVAFDIEDTSANGTPYHTFSKILNSAIVKAFLDEIEGAGYYGLLYTYKSFAENYLDMENLKAYDIWLAQYADKCTYKGSYGIWQYAGDSGRCDGVAGACDLNVAYKDYEAIIRNAGLNGFIGQLSGDSGIAAAEAENKKLRERINDLTEKMQKISELSNIW